MSILRPQPTEITNLPKQIKEWISQKIRGIISMKIMGLAVSRDSRVSVQCQIGAVTNLSTSSIWGKHNARLFASQQFYRECEMIYSILWIICHTQEQRKSIKYTLRTRRHYWPLLSIFTHWPLLKFHILRQPSLPPVTSLQVKIRWKNTAKN